jgi:hypothetical protein
MHPTIFERRRFLKSSALGILGITSFGYASASETLRNPLNDGNSEPIFYRYPAMNDAMASGIVGASHGNFDKVKEMVGKRPELAGAAWDWGFGDFETALGAASHVGRRDIAEFLMSHGARPDIFTFTMMGMLKSVQEMIETVPGIETHPGPHGISLMAHARNRLTDKNISAADSANMNKMISYLQSLVNADPQPKSMEITEEEKLRYLGEYRYGAAEGEILLMDMTAKKQLKLARKGVFGSVLRKVDDNTFSPAGAASVKIIFQMKDDKAASFTVHEPEPLVTALRV